MRKEGMLLGACAAPTSCRCGCAATPELGLCSASLLTRFGGPRFPHQALRDQKDAVEEEITAVAQVGRREKRGMGAEVQ